MAEHEHPASPADEGSHTQMDDINIPLVAVSVVFFGVFLVVLIVGLQAWFYNASAAELAAKTLPQEHEQTELGGLLKKQRDQLAGHPDPVVAVATTTAPGTTTTAASQPRPRIPVESAMAIIAKQYKDSPR